MEGTATEVTAMEATTMVVTTLERIISTEEKGGTTFNKEKEGIISERGEIISTGMTITNKKVETTLIGETTSTRVIRVPHVQDPQKTKIRTKVGEGINLPKEV